MDSRFRGNDAVDEISVAMYCSSRVGKPDQGGLKRGVGRVLQIFPIRG